MKNVSISLCMLFLVLGIPMQSLGVRKDHYIKIIDKSGDGFSRDYHKISENKWIKYSSKLMCKGGDYQGDSPKYYMRIQAYSTPLFGPGGLTVQNGIGEKGGWCIDPDTSGGWRKEYKKTVNLRPEGVPCYSWEIIREKSRKIKIINTNGGSVCPKPRG